MAEIQLTQGLTAIIDDEDRERIRGYKWFTQKIGEYTYAAASARTHDSHVYMHRLIMGLGRADKQHVHHRSENGLDNRRSNLQVLSVKEHLSLRKLSRHALQRERLEAGVKFCPRCRAVRTLEYFGEDLSREDGKALHCCICVHKMAKAKRRLASDTARFKAGLKLCTKCGQVLLQEFFNANRLNWDDKSCHCRACYSKASKRRWRARKALLVNKEQRIQSCG